MGNMATKRRKKEELGVEMVQLPPLPEELWTPLGMVKVIEVEGLSDGTEPLAGQWDKGARVIRICKGMNGVTAWQTLGHELAHLVMDDAGVVLAHKGEESVCQGFGSFFAAYVLAGFPFPFSTGE